MGLDCPLNCPAQRRALSAVNLSLVGLALLLLPACQTRRYDPVPLYPVRGKVLFNGQPAVGAEVRFHPVTPSDKGIFSPAAKVEADGTFALTTYENKDGAPPGEYMVTIRWDAVSYEEATLPDRLKGRYSNPKKSPWRIQVREVANNLEPFHIK
jgi:hypothetical protein